jgi:hypothetical protein
MLDGTDCLELVFSSICTQDHSSSVDTLQLGQKAGVGAVCEAVYSRNKDLDQGHKRLQSSKLDLDKGSDHMRPLQWRDDLVQVGGVKLDEAWNQGYVQAYELIAQYFPEADPVNLKDYFVKHPKSSFMDLEETKSSKKTNLPGSQQSSTFIHGYDNVYDAGTGSDTDNEMGWHGDLDHLISLANLNNQGDDSDLQILEDVLLVNSDLASHSVNSGQQISVPDAQTVQYLMIDGKRVHTASRVASELSLHEKQSTDCNRRVQGINWFDPGGGSAKNGMAQEAGSTAVRDLDINNTEMDETIAEGDYIASLARVIDGKSKPIVCLIIIEVLFISQGSTSHFSLSYDTFKNSNNLYVTGQVINVQDVEQIGANILEWNATYITPTQASKRTLKATRNQGRVHVPGRLTLRIDIGYVDGNPQ